MGTTEGLEVDDEHSALSPQVPQTRLFFSVDLVGSTAYKQSEPKWQPKFLTFYREFPQYLAESLKRLENKLPKEVSPPKPTFWKAVGDELLFVCPVDDRRQVRIAVDAWLNAQTAYEKETLQREKMQKTKGAVFAATFPGPDCLVAIPRDPELGAGSDKSVVQLNDEALKSIEACGKMANDQYLLDFLGPSIDTGFRIIAKSTERFFTMSVEVAWAYSEENRMETDGSQEKREVELLGQYPLKGVWEGRPYPVFAIDRMANDQVNLALKKVQGVACEPEDINKIFMACEQSDNWPSRLYFPNGTSPLTTNEPADVIHTGDNSSVDMNGYEEKANASSADSSDTQSREPKEDYRKGIASFEELWEEQQARERAAAKNRYIRRRLH